MTHMDEHKTSDNGPWTIRVQYARGTLRTYTADRFHITPAGVLVLEGTGPTPTTLHISPHTWATFYAQPTTPTPPADYGNPTHYDDGTPVHHGG